MKKILCICMSSTIQRTVSFDALTLEKVNRSKHYRQDASGKAVNSARVLEQLESGCSTVVCPLGEKNLPMFTDAAARDNLNLLYTTIPGLTRECWTLLDRTAGTTTELVVGEPLLESDQELKAVAAAEIKILKVINDILPEVDAVLLAGSRPKIWSEDLYATIPGQTRECWTLLDRTAGTTTELVVGEPLLEGADELKAVAAAGCDCNKKPGA